MGIYGFFFRNGTISLVTDDAMIDINQDGIGRCIVASTPKHIESDLSDMVDIVPWKGWVFPILENAKVSS